MTSARPLFVLHHGWALDATLWDSVRAALAATFPGHDCLVLDAGYFGGRHLPDLPAGRPLIGVGHSWGTMALLSRHDIRWAGFAAVNGFARFAWADDHPAGVRRRLIDTMLRRFDEDHAAVVAEFRTRCGAAAPLPAHLETGCLGDDLRGLRDMDTRAQADALDCPVLLLAGDADPIVAPDLTRAAATSFGPHTALEWFPGGGHLLPLQAPEWCAGRLKEYVERLAF